jgi:hypothetical protein
VLIFYSSISDIVSIFGYFYDLEYKEMVFLIFTIISIISSTEQRK